MIFSSWKKFISLKKKFESKGSIFRVISNKIKILINTIE